MSDLPDWKTIPRTELDKLLAAYCAEGLTASAIAKKFLNASRSAVIGRVHRKKFELGSGQPRKGMVGCRKAGTTTAEPKPPKAKAPARRASKLVQQTSSWRGANNPPATDFKARAEQRAKSPGIVIKRENAFDPIPDTPPRGFWLSGLPLAGRRHQRSRSPRLWSRKNPLRDTLLRGALPPRLRASHPPIEHPKRRLTPPTDHKGTRHDIDS